MEDLILLIQVSSLFAFSIINIINHSVTERVSAVRTLVMSFEPRFDALRVEEVVALCLSEILLEVLQTDRTGVVVGRPFCLQSLLCRVAGLKELHVNAGLDSLDSERNPSSRSLRSQLTLSP